MALPALPAHADFWILMYANEINRNRQANAVYPYLVAAEFKKAWNITPNVNYDLSANGRIIGVEVLNRRSWFGDLDG